ANRSSRYLPSPAVSSASEAPNARRGVSLILSTIVPTVVSVEQPSKAKIVYHE
ncbi:hypothetical protein U1Q18_014160, partial [Sarracenia purpurea var. burkii]